MKEETMHRLTELDDIRMLISAAYRKSEVLHGV